MKTQTAFNQSFNSSNMDIKSVELFTSGPKIKGFLQYLQKVTVEHNKIQFPYSTFRRLLLPWIETVDLSKSSDTALENFQIHILNAYLDCRFYFLKLLEAQFRDAPLEQELANQKRLDVPTHLNQLNQLTHRKKTDSLRWYTFLHLLPVPEKENSQSQLQSDETLKTQTLEESLVDTKSEPKCLIMTHTPIQRLIYRYKNLYSRVWLAFLRKCQHPESLLGEILNDLPTRLLPYISNPLVLADFYVGAFNHHQPLFIRILALSGLFYLLTQHRLADPQLLQDEEKTIQNTEYSNESHHKDVSDLHADEMGITSGQRWTHHYYQNLFELITPQTFVFSKRIRFMKLLEVSLQSPLLPSYLRAAFIKKLCRTACLVPIPAAFWLAALSFQLLQKFHATCWPLLSVDRQLSENWKPKGDKFDYLHVDILPPSDNTTSTSIPVTTPLKISQQHTQKRRLLDEVDFSLCAPKRLRKTLPQDTLKYNPLVDLSLWETQVLQHHLHPGLAIFSRLIQSEKWIKQSHRIDCDDFLLLHSKEILKKSVKKLFRQSSFQVALKPWQDTPDLQALFKAASQTYQD